MPAAANRPRRRWFFAAATCAALGITGCSAGQDAQTVQQTSVVDGTAFQAGLIDLRDVGVRAPSSGASLAKGGTAYLEGVIVNSGVDDDELVSVSTPLAGSVAFYPDGVTAVVGLAAGATGSAQAGAPSTSADETGQPLNDGTAQASASASASASLSESGTASPTTSSSSSSSSASSSVALDTLDVRPNIPIRVGYENGDVQIVLRDLTTSIGPAQNLPITFTFAQAGSVTVTIAVKLVTDATSLAPSVDTAESGEG